jgi:hypothetical protein
MTQLQPQGILDLETPQFLVSYLDWMMYIFIIHTCLPLAGHSHEDRADSVGEEEWRPKRSVYRVWRSWSDIQRVNNDSVVYGINHCH